MKPKNLICLLFGFTAIAFVVSCERDWNNPWDEFNNLSPEAWAPQNLQIEDVSITEKKLTWAYGDYNIEGFKIDRKKGDEPWQVAYQSLPKEARNWSDTEIVPDPSLTFSYRLYAFAGKYSSAEKSSNADVEFPAPSNLQININSVSSVRLDWMDKSNGEDGFKIDRKLNDGFWEEKYATITSGNDFSDNGLDLNNNVYYYRIYAFYNQYESVKTENMITLKCGYPFTDSRDGNKYETIQISDQCWMKENLAWLPNVSPSAYESITSVYNYVYGYEGTSVIAAKATYNYQTYGVLYNWQAALIACPEGWHLPSDTEWSVLTDYLGGENIAGGKMKEAGAAHWNSPNTGATNSSGFTGLPGGYAKYGTYGSIKGIGNWWSAKEYSTLDAWFWNIFDDNVFASSYQDTKSFGLSVRCIKD